MKWTWGCVAATNAVWVFAGFISAISMYDSLLANVSGISMIFSALIVHIGFLGEIDGYFRERLSRD